MNKLKYIFFSIILFYTILVAQPPVEFLRAYEFEDVYTFYDIYAVSNGDYVVCGKSVGGRQGGSFMVVGRLDQAGGLIWSWSNGDRNFDYRALTIIETENSNFLTGGNNYDSESRISRFIVSLIDGEGETIWIRDYGVGTCYAVIELKSGEYLLAGESNNVAQLILINDDGEIIWQETYDHDNDNNVQFMAIRETEGGVVASGRIAVWVIKVDVENGDVIWSRDHGANARYCYDMTSTVDGGFVMALTTSGGVGNLGLFEVDDERQEVWNRTYQLEGNRGSNWATGVTRLNDGGFAIVGRHSINGRSHPVVIRTNSNGNIRWMETYNVEDWDGIEGLSMFYGVTRGLDGSIIAVGMAQMALEGHFVDAILMKLEPLVLEPIIFEWSPKDTVFSVLLGDTITFMARARDQQGDELSNLWIVNADTLGTDTTETIIFDELGEYLVQCQISDGENIAVIRWHVTAEEFYIDAYAPDSLSWTIQRDRKLDFSLDVRAIEGLEPNYRWILTDRNQRQNDIGEEADVSHHFDLAGNFGLEGRVYHEGVEHSVHWRINVRSLLYWWTPHEREFEIPIPREVEFSVIPFQPIPDSMEFMWFINGIDEEIYDLGLFHTFRDTGVHTVTAIAYDGAEADTVVWTVRAFDPDAIGDASSSLLPTEVTLYPAAPNPFNSTTRVRYFLPSAGVVRLSIYDSAGRLVQTLADGRQIAGDQRATLQGSDLPAGVYLLRLEAGSVVKTGKVVLLK